MAGAKTRIRLLTSDLGDRISDSGLARHLFREHSGHTGPHGSSPDGGGAIRSFCGCGPKGSGLVSNCLVGEVSHARSLPAQSSLRRHHAMRRDAGGSSFKDAQELMLNYVATTDATGELPLYNPDTYARALESGRVPGRRSTNEV